jgi:hypothetical protein
MPSARIRNRRSSDKEKAPPGPTKNGGKSIKWGKADWHIDILIAIESGNWERVRELIRLLGKYQDSLDPAKNQDKKMRKPSFWKRLSSQTEKESGLLTRDREGRTPLHLALSSKDTPTDIAVALVQLEPKAAAISNERERLPLHFAVVHQHHNDVLSELIEAFPAALAATDVNDKSPLAYAMDMAKHRTDVMCAPRTYWMPPEVGSEEAKWQAKQGETWDVVHWLLLSSATHPQASLSVGGKKPMLVDALVHAAPPPVISLLIGASSMLLSFDNRATAFAGSTLYSCITRHYPLAILKSLAAQCPKDVRTVRDETGMGLISALFISGCFEPIKNTGEWKPSPAFFTAFEDSVHDGRLSNDVIGFQDWWRKIEFLIAFCTGGNPEEVTKEYLLHAALSNSDVPPAVIRLLLSLYPKSVSLDDPKLGVRPIYLASAGREYIPRQYELEMEGNNKSGLEMIAVADAKAITTRHEERLPLSVAIESGKTLASLVPLITPNEKSLRQRDPKTKLYPFQQVAAYPNISEKDSVRWSCVARNKYSHAVWKGLSDRQKAAAVYCVFEEDSLSRLETIFVLLRRQPSATKPDKPNAVPISVARDSSGMGDGLVPAEQSLAGATKSPDKIAISPLATGTGTQESQKDDVRKDLAANDDNDSDDDSVGLEQIFEQRPSSLVRLLSSDATKGTETEDDVFECDASLFSNVDVMSTLSEISTTQHSKRALATGSLSNHPGMQKGWSDEDFGSIEGSFMLEESSPRLNYSDGHDEIPDETSGHMDFAEDSGATVIEDASRPLHQSKQEEDIDDVDTTESSSESVVVFKIRRKQRGEYWKDDAVRLKKKLGASSSSLANPRKANNHELSGSIHSTCSDSSASMASFYLTSRDKNLLGDLNSSSASESRADTNTSSSLLENMLEGPTNHNITQKLKGSVDMMWMNDEASVDDSFAVEEIVPMPNSTLTETPAQQRDSSSWEPEDSFAIDYEIPPAPPSAILSNNAIQKEEIAAPVSDQKQTESVASDQVGSTDQPPFLSQAEQVRGAGHSSPMHESRATTKTNNDASGLEDSFAVDEIVPMPNSTLTETSEQQRDEDSWEPEDSFAMDYEMPPSPPSAILSIKAIQREEMVAPVSVQKKMEIIASDQVGRIDQPAILNQDERVRGAEHSSPIDETKPITKTNSDASGGLSNSIGNDAHLSARSDSEDEDSAMYFDAISMRWKKGRPEPAPNEESFYASYRSLHSSSSYMSTQNSEVSSQHQSAKGKLMAPPAMKRSELRNPFVDVLSREKIRKKNKAFSKARHAADASYPEDVLAKTEGTCVKTPFHSQPPSTETLSPRKMKSSWYAMLGRDRKLSCLFCSENNREVLMLPCRHLCICRHCSVKQKRISFCPLCQGEVTDTILLF